MEKRTVGIIVTIVATLFCGCPGLFAAFWGIMVAGISFMPNAQIDMGGSSDPATALGIGLGTCCVGLIFIVIPIAVGFFTLRKQAEIPTSDMPVS